jgi:hypothetical protein
MAQGVNEISFDKLKLMGAALLAQKGMSHHES